MPVSVTLILMFVLALVPEARTVCGKAACTGLLRGTLGDQRSYRVRMKAKRDVRRRVCLWTAS